MSENLNMNKTIQDNSQNDEIVGAFQKIKLNQALFDKAMAVVNKKENLEESEELSSKESLSAETEEKSEQENSTSAREQQTLEPANQNAPVILKVAEQAKGATEKGSEQGNAVEESQQSQNASADAGIPAKTGSEENPQQPLTGETPKTGDQILPESGDLNGAEGDSKPQQLLTVTQKADLHNDNTLEPQQLTFKSLIEAKNKQNQAVLSCMFELDQENQILQTQNLRLNIQCKNQQLMFKKIAQNIKEQTIEIQNNTIAINECRVRLIKRRQQFQALNDEVKDSESFIYLDVDNIQYENMQGGLAAISQGNSDEIATLKETLLNSEKAIRDFNKLNMKMLK